MTKCSVPSCSYSKKHVHNVHMFSFPSGRKDVWCNNLNLDPTTISLDNKVCFKHFDENAVFKFSTKVRLKPGANPRITNNSRIDNALSDTIPKVEVEQQPKCRVRRKYRTPVVTKKACFRIEYFKNNDKKICFYTGIQTYKIFLIIFRFVFKDERGPRGAVHQTTKKLKGAVRKPHGLTPLNEYFLTLMRLRQAFSFGVLADMFNISTSAAGKIFVSWINLLYFRLGSLKVFAHRDILISGASKKFLRKYPGVIGSIDCTEFPIERPSALQMQSQSYSQYKGTNTLKALIMINPEGAIVFISNLFTGSISDKKIVEESNFLRLLKTKVDNGELHQGDIILADKGFNIEELMENTGVQLNIPTFRMSGITYTSNEVEYIRKIAQERVHVERAIRRIKTFKILSHRIQISMMGNINQIFAVCAILTGFMSPLIKRHNELD